LPLAPEQTGHGQQPTRKMSFKTYLSPAEINFADCTWTTLGAADWIAANP